MELYSGYSMWILPLETEMFGKFSTVPASPHIKDLIYSNMDFSISCLIYNM